MLTSFQQTAIHQSLRGLGIINESVLSRASHGWGQHFASPVFQQLFEEVLSIMFGENFTALSLLRREQFFWRLGHIVLNVIWYVHGCVQCGDMFRLSS